MERFNLKKLNDLALKEAAG